MQLCFLKSCEAARQLPVPRPPSAARSLHAPSVGAGAWERGGVSMAPHTPLQEGTQLARALAELADAASPRWPTSRAGSSRALLALVPAPPTHLLLTVPASRARAAPASIARPKRIAAPKRIAVLATAGATRALPAATVPLWRPAQQLVHGRMFSGAGGGTRGSGAGAGGGGNRAGTLLLGASVASMVGGGTWYYHYQRQGRQTGAPLGVGVRVAASDASHPADTSGAGHGKGSQSLCRDYRDFMA